MSKKFASPLCLGFAAIKSHLKVSPAKIRFAVNYARNTLCTILFSPEDLQSVKFCRSIDAVAFYEAHLSTYSVLTFMTRYTMANCCGTFILCKLPSWINGRTLYVSLDQYGTAIDTKVPFQTPGPCDRTFRLYIVYWCVLLYTAVD